MDDARTVVLPQLFVHHQCPLLEQALYNGQDVEGLLGRAKRFASPMYHLRSIEGLLEVLDALFAQAFHEVEHVLLVACECHIAVVVGIILHQTLALQLQPAGQRGPVDLAQGAQVVVGYPMPEPQLFGQQHGGRVEDVEDFLEDPLRLPREGERFGSKSFRRFR